MDISERSERRLDGGSDENLTGIPIKAFLGTMRPDIKDQKEPSAPPWRLKHPASRYLKIKHLQNFRECFFLSREL